MKSLLNKLIKETPCKVVFEDNQYTEIILSDYANALYKDWGKEQIFISNKISIESQIADLLHEGTHAEHDKKGCKCAATSDGYLGEYHALSVALRKAIKTGNKKIIKLVLLSIDRNSKDYGYYQKAADKVKKLKIYKKAKDLLAKVKK